MFIPIIGLIIAAIYLYGQSKAIESLQDQITDLRDTIKHLTGKTPEEINENYFDNLSEDL